MKKLILALAAALSCNGCLIEDVRYDIYLEPDGSVEWITIQSNVRSDETNPAKRREEEMGFLSAAGKGEHPVARELEALGGKQIQTLILRDQVPYAVLTTARFRSIEEVFRNMLREGGVEHEVKLERGVMVDGTLCHRLTLWAAYGDPSEGRTSPIEDLADYLDEMRLNLVTGRFVAARGFEISGGSQARLIENESGDEKAENGRSMKPGTFWLAWTPEG